MPETDFSVSGYQTLYHTSAVQGTGPSQTSVAQYLLVETIGVVYCQVLASLAILFFLFLRTLLGPSSAIALNTSLVISVKLTVMTAPPILASRALAMYVRVIQELRYMHGMAMGSSGTGRL